MHCEVQAAERWDWQFERCDVEELIKRLRDFRDKRDWAQFHHPKDLAISVTVEASELLELFQWMPGEAAPDESLIKNAASEAADIFIYLILFADRLGFDLLDAANNKVAENEQRFPEAQSFGVAKPAKDN